MKLSLRAKTAILIILLTVVLGAASIVISSQALRQVVDDSYRSKANGVANSMAAVLDIEKAASLKDAVMSMYQETEDKVSSDEWGTPEFETYISRFSSISSLPTVIFPSNSAAICSMIGERILQGPHQVAKKSTITAPFPSVT